MASELQNRRRSRFRAGLTRAWRSLRTFWDFYLFAGGFFLVFAMFGVAALVFPELPGEAIVGSGPLMNAQGPDASHWFGTNRDRLDLLGPVFAAAGRSLWLAALATLFGALAGMVASTALFFGGGEPGVRLAKRIGGFATGAPALVLLVILAAGHGAGAGATFWMLAALVGLFLVGRSAEWYRGYGERNEVVAARALGFSKWRILVGQCLPQVGPRLAASAATLLPGVLLAEAALGFVGAGEAEGRATGRLGAVLAAGREAMFDLPWMLLYPGLVLAGLVIVLGALAWALRRTLDEPIDDRLF